MNKELILLSGGLDSMVALGLSKNVELALTFDYGQKAFVRELEASIKISRHFGVEHRIIRLGWLEEITDRSRVWVPNRNGLFLNIAASFAEAQNFTHIIIGANAEEAQNFPDNTAAFIERTNAAFEYSTLCRPKVVAPLINCSKSDIVKLAHNMPLEYVWSCYEDGEEHCGQCESCKRSYNAITIGVNEREDSANCHKIDRG
jgi:7-cyano-7-deazaguanine synthase